MDHAYEPPDPAGPAFPMYCIECGYPLDAARPRCAECGLGFDPNDPGTYRPDDRPRLPAPFDRFVRHPAAWLLTLAPIAGALELFLLADWQPPWFTALLVAIVALCWCDRDAAARNRPFGRARQLATFLVPFILVPAWLLETRGLRRGLVACVGAAALLVIAVWLSAAGRAIAMILT